MLLLSVTVYEVHVATGELWNAGTVANVYIAVYGEKGDTGSRQLFRSKSTLNFLRGQVSNKKSFVLLSWCSGLSQKYSSPHAVIKIALCKPFCDNATVQQIPLNLAQKTPFILSSE